MFAKKSDKDKLLKDAFSKIKAELEDHLDTINENTNEIQSNYNYISELDLRIEKLNEKMDEILMLLQGKSAEPKKIKLNLREQEVFLVLYTANDKLNYAAIARRLGLTEELVKDHVQSIIKKGVPIVKQYDGGVSYLYIEQSFMSSQAKFNVVDLDPGLRKEILDSIKAPKDA